MKYSIKMIVTDLDGTLLRDDKTVSERTQAILRRCRDKGIKIVYATARGGDAEELTYGIPFDGFIANNGALAVAGDEVVYNRPVPDDFARLFLDICEARGLSAGSHRDHGKLYVEDCGLEEDAFIKWLLPKDLYFVVSWNKVGMIMHREATKSNAVVALARRWNIMKEEIVAFGDDLNDIDLLGYAGYGVAMGNALEGVRAAAQYHCLGNEEDGLADWIERNVL